MLELQTDSTPGTSDELDLALEQLGLAIAESQAALLSGRVRDLEASTLRQQELRKRFERLPDSKSESTDRGRDQLSRSRLLASARRIHFQNRVFGGVLERMKRNLEAWQRLVQGCGVCYAYVRDDSVLGAKQEL
jgi:hypothetical protein